MTAMFRRELLFSQLLFFWAIAAKAEEFYVTGHGWHTGIVVPRAAVMAAEAWPPGVAASDFAGCPYLEVGWGDRKFYMAKSPGVAMAIGAALVPGPSVLHIVGYQGTPERTGMWTDLIRVPCSRAELHALCRAIGAAFDRAADGHALALGRGLYGFKSQFYAARGRYWIGNTCNSWTLRTERAGGLPVHVGVLGTLRASAVIAQTRAVLNHPRKRPADPR